MQGQNNFKTTYFSRIWLRFQEKTFFYRELSFALSVGNALSETAAAKKLFHKTFLQYLD